jgi:hypothetical protein
MKHNVTLALPKDLLKEARHMAVERETSLSELLAESLRKALAEDGAYRDAMARAQERMRTGFDLGTGGASGWTREDLHER